LGDVSQLTLTVIRVAFLVLLWLFVLTTVSVMRTDLFGPPATDRRPPATRNRPQARPRSTAQAPAGRPTATPAASGASYAPPPAPRRRAPWSRSPRPPRSVVVTTGPLAGTAIPLGDGPITLGRASDATLALPDEYASAHHARLMPRDGQWWVEDLGSTNGTYVDGVRITGPRPVSAGTPIRVGKTSLELRA
jgi:hypothetical protein